MGEKVARIKRVARQRKMRGSLGRCGLQWARRFCARRLWGSQRAVSYTHLRPRRAGNFPRPTIHSERSYRARTTRRLLYSPAGFPFLLDSEPVLTAPGMPPPRGRVPRPRRAGNSPRPTVRGERLRQARAIGHLLHSPAGFSILPDSELVLIGLGAPPPRGREPRPRRAGNSPRPTVHSGRLRRAQAIGHLFHSPAGFSFLLDSEPVLAIPGASPPLGREPRPNRAGNSPRPK